MAAVAVINNPAVDTVEAPFLEEKPTEKNFGGLTIVVANPFYCGAFSYMMCDNKIAKMVISTLIDEEIQEDREKEALLRFRQSIAGQFVYASNQEEDYPRTKQKDEDISKMHNIFYRAGRINNQGKQPPQNEAEEFLAMFDEKYYYNGGKRYLEIPFDDVPEKFYPVLFCLSKAALDPGVCRNMTAQDEFDREFEWRRKKAYEKGYKIGIAKFAKKAYNEGSSIEDIAKCIDLTPQQVLDIISKKSKKK